MKKVFSDLKEKYAVSGRAGQFIDKAVQYHGFPAPGVILGAYMIDLALEKLDTGPDEKLFAIAETSKCLSDSIGIITGCTPGSSKFLLFDTGRLSLAIGKDDGTGIAKCVRAFVAHEKTEGYPALMTWYYNEPDSKNDLPALLEDILKAGRSILLWEYVNAPIPPKDQDWKPAFCIKCGEMIPDKKLENGLCKACATGSCYII
ncbi:formylmethanofuran dehydrogenase [Methanocella sp. CWC-04]|uniref:Formylmethanofuran dehydrogenase n=1 Tax=Methanooceanicella nereidis TaxID=2052831 RepID=A0AAP2REF1_9EURY|nr:FmdE family protein [Methanocella sp. CWC-04]MCD1295040.1 formylmethanofuran dehydrogenase [Methanocella sp. CWC-04]